MKNLTYPLFVILIPHFLFAQLDAGSNIIICDFEEITLSANYNPLSAGTSDYTIESISLNMDPSNTGTELVGLNDDAYTEAIDIGFDFCFYENIFNQLLISTNNYISFDIANSNGYSPWTTYQIPSALPPGNVVNAIMGPWMDLNPNNGGNLYYNVYGVAPFRRFVVSYQDFGYYGCAGLQYNGQIKIFETTNVIEIHIQNQPLCASWNNGESVLGIVNEDESQFVIEIGWNNTQMTGNFQGFRFTPNANSNSLTWTDDSGNIVGNGQQITVTPLTTTTYTVTAEECSNNLTDEVSIIFSPPINFQAIVDDNLCPGEFYGGIDITAIGGTGTLQYSWTSLSTAFSSTNEDISNLFADTYYLNIEDQVGCESEFGPFVISPAVNPIVFDEIIERPSCYGFNDGQISTSINGGTPSYTYDWTSDEPITGNGTNTITSLYSGEYRLLITDNNGCKDSVIYNLIDQSPINVTNNLSDYNGYNVSCYGMDDGWISSTVEGGITPYDMEWKNQNNNIISKYSDIHNIESGTYIFTATDASGCSITNTFNISQPDPLSINIIDYSHKSCTYNDDGFIEVVSNGGLDIPANSQNYLPHTYRWEANNTFYSNDQNIYKLAENIYTLSIKDSNNCQEEMTFEITQPPFVIASYRTIDDIVTTNYPIVNLYDNSQGNVIEWQWELNNVLLANSQDVMNIDLTSDLDSSGIKYYDLKLVVTDEFMCKDSIYGRLAIKEEHTLFVPNGFTPDFDGNNDAFKIFHHAMKTETFSMVVYDRWGSLVFESNNPDISWDGTNMKTGNPLVTGIYSYLLSYQDFESRIYDYTNCENCYGTITLVR